MFIYPFEDYEEIKRWRYAYRGGRDFVNLYLEKLSTKEDDDDFAARKRLTYCPSFAAEAIDEIKDAIIHRATDIVRTGGPETYRKAINGELGGVDLRGSSMSMFLGNYVLPELLPMSTVGVLVDNFDNLGRTLADKGNKHPYFTVFARENILAHTPEIPFNGYDSVLLQETIYEVDKYGRKAMFPTTRNRYYEKVDTNTILVKIGNVDADWKNGKEYILNIPEIPFHIFQLRRSLMKDVADYQIALLNIESSDISFIRCANFPIYYEFYKARGSAGDYSKPTRTADTREVEVGAGTGRRFPDGLEKPGFIAPNADTLRASMEKGAQIKKDIRSLVRLNLSMLEPQRQSVESKGYDERSLESGLSQLGLILQTGEQELAKYWSYFEGAENDVKIGYPKTYDLQNDETRLRYSDKLRSLANSVPSDSFQREVQKLLSYKLMGHVLPKSTMDEIFEEIEESETITSDPNIILSAHKAGLCSDYDAAKALGFSEESVDQARKDRAERIKLTLEAQGGADNADANRGAPEFDKGVPSDEKEGKAGRGNQDNTNIGGE